MPSDKPHPLAGSRLRPAGGNELGYEIPKKGVFLKPKDAAGKAFPPFHVPKDATIETATTLLEQHFIDHGETPATLAAQHHARDSHTHLTLVTCRQQWS